MTQKTRRSTTPLVMEPAPDSREARHNDVLASVVFDQLGAELKGFAECVATYFETLMLNGFTRDEAMRLADSFAFQYWEAQNNAAAAR